MALPSAISMLCGFGRTTRTALAVYPSVQRQTPVLFGILVTLFYRSQKQDVYNILWAVVFGFATLNILSLAAKRHEPNRRGLSIGELMAVMVVVLSVLLLGWEMLTLFHVLPIKLKR